VLCAAMQGVPPEEYRSQGPAAAATREPVASKARAIDRDVSIFELEDMFGVWYDYE
jgi:hypothetical protein